MNPIVSHLLFGIFTFAIGLGIGYARGYSSCQDYFKSLHRALGRDSERKNEGSVKDQIEGKLDKQSKL